MTNAPQGSWRYPPRYQWNDSYSTPTGDVRQLSSAGEERQPLVANLVVPDVTERNGWRQWYVYRDAPPVPPPRGLGLGRG